MKGTWISGFPWVLALPTVAVLIAGIIADKTYKPEPGYPGTVLSIDKAVYSGTSIGGLSYKGTGFVSGGNRTERSIELVIQTPKFGKIAAVCDGTFFHSRYEDCLSLSNGDTLTVYRNGGVWRVTP